MAGVCLAGGMHGGGCAWWVACMVGRVCVAGEMAIAVGSMHPTGMHSCQIINLL